MAATPTCWSCLAVTDRAAHTHGLSAFAIEKGMKGFRLGKKKTSWGLRASDTSELISKIVSCRLKIYWVEKGTASSTRCGCSMGEEYRLPRFHWAWRKAPTMAALKYSKQRKQFGKAISEFQAIQWKLADMATEIEAAKLLTLRAGRNERCRDEDDS